MKTFYDYDYELAVHYIGLDSGYRFFKCTIEEASEAISHMTEDEKKKFRETGESSFSYGDLRRNGILRRIEKNSK